MATRLPLDGRVRRTQKFARTTTPHDGNWSPRNDTDSDGRQFQVFLPRSPKPLYARNVVRASARVTWVDYPAVAYHVAAHIVMQLQLGRRVYYASLQRREEHGRCTDGELEGSNALSRRDALTRAAFERDALYRIAGRAFEAHCIGWSGEWYSEKRLTGLADEDRKAVRRVLDPLQLTHDAQALSLKWVEAQAGRFFEDQDVIYRVTRFAQALIEHDYLTETTITQLSQAIDALFPPRRRLRPEPRLPLMRRVVDPTSPVLRPSRLRSAGESFEFRRPSRRVLEPPDTTSPRRAMGRRPEATDDVIGTPLAELGLSNIALNTLRKRGGIASVEVLLTYSDERLLDIRTLGMKTLAEIRRALERARH